MAANVFELVCFNRYRQARLVLEAGGDPNFPNDQQETPLMACAMFLREPDRRMQLMRMLIGFGADVNAQNDKGQTLMMYACILNQVDTLVLLINKENVDLNKCDVSGNTALMYACALGRAPLVYVLLEVHRSGQHPINIYQRNHEGHTAREIAEQRRFSQICELFAEAVDNDYWSSYNELSRDTTIANGKAYPVKIEENRIESQPQTDPSTHPDLTTMMERILQIGNEQRVEQNNFVPTSDKTIPGVSSDAVCFNTTDAGVAKPDDNDNPENYPKSARSSRTDGSLGWECKNVSEGKLSAKSNVEYTDGSITDRSRRKKSRQRSKHRAVADAQNGTGEPQNGLTRSGSFRNRNSLMKSGSGESGDTVENEDIVVGPTIANVTGNDLEESNPDKNSIKTSNTKKVNYYTRHDIPDYNPAPSLGTVDVNGDSIRPPRPPSRSRSRARRRKTTEVCVTVSDGKIVPFRKHSGTKASGGSTEDGLLSTWPVPEGTYAGTINQQHAHSNGVTATDSSSRSPIRAQMQTNRRLEQKPSSPNSSMDFDSAYSQLVNPNYNKYTNNCGYATNLYSERNYKTPWTGRQKVSNYDCNPRNRGADMRDSIDCSSGGIFREGNKLTRTSIFKDSSRKAGSYRSVAW